MAAPAFGDPSRYYARTAQSRATPQSPQGRLVEPNDETQEAAEFIRDITSQWGQTLSLAVERAVRQWNQHIRECLRLETGLRLATEDAQRSVPVKVVAGLPEPFAAVVARHPDPAEWELYLRRATLATTADGLSALETRYGEIIPVDILGSSSLVSRNQVAEVLALVRALLTWLEKSHVPTEIFDVDHDVLGAYFIHRHEIHIYWMAVAIVSGILKQPIDAVTVVVLAHELAHAYTHLGFDIDKRDWPTQAFVRLDLGIAEGLAQHYTRVVCENRLLDRFPAAGEAYRSLVQMQRGPYRIHESWFGCGVTVGEAVRLAMLTTRLDGSTGYGEFESNLERAKVATTKAGRGTT